MHVNHTFGTVSILFTAFMLSACSSVSSNHPIGQPVKDDLSEAFDGVWATGEGVAHCGATGEGRLRVASVEFEDGDFKMKTMDLLITEHNGTRFLHFTDENDANRKFFSRFTLTKEGDLVLFGPDIPAFAKAIDAKEIKGTVERKNNLITAKITGPAKELNAYLTKARIRDLFPTEKPTVIRRVAKDD